MNWPVCMRRMLCKKSLTGVLSGSGFTTVFISFNSGRTRMMYLVDDADEGAVCVAGRGALGASREGNRSTQLRCSSRRRERVKFLLPFKSCRS